MCCNATATTSSSAIRICFWYRLFNDIDDNVHAREYLKQAEYYYKQTHFSLNRIYFFQALLTDDTKQKTKWIKKSIACGGNDWALTVQDYIQLSELLLHAGDVKGALMTCNEGDSLNNKHLGGNVYFTTLLSIARAKVYYQRGLYATTIDIIGHLKPHAAMLHGETFMLDAYYLMWKSYDKVWANSHRPIGRFSNIRSNTNATLPSLKRMTFPKHRLGRKS